MDKLIELIKSNSFSAAEKLLRKKLEELPNKTNRPNSSKLAMKKAVKRFLLNCLIFNVDQLGLEPRTSRL